MPAPAYVALETTLLLHGVPPEAARPLAQRLGKIVRDHGAIPRLVGVVHGQPIVGMSDEQLDVMLAARDMVGKTNTANLGVAMFRGRHAATTVSTTMELAARAGLSVFATGGIGGVHKFLSPTHAPRPMASPFDISADLAALTRFPIAVVASGVKSILDVAATREVLETLGIPVIGYRTEAFPAFYLRELREGSVGKVDYSFDDAAELGRFVRFELARTTRGILICNPIPLEHELKVGDWNTWLAAAQAKVAASEAGSSGRDATPALLSALHEVSGGATLRANIELVASNAALAAQVAVGMLRE